MTAQPVLQATNIGLRYPGESRAVLQTFNFALDVGETVSILGSSGIGKSSLLRVLAGLQQPTDGIVRMNGMPLHGVNPRVSIAFQDPSLLPWLSLEKNVAFGLGFKHQPHLSREESHARVDAAINEVGLSHARRLFPDQLSGGEPFGALDEVTRTEMQHLLLKIVRNSRTAAVLITHDVDEALLISDRVILLGGAPAHQIGEWTIDLSKPREDYVAELGTIRVEILRALRSGSPQLIEGLSHVH